MTERVIVIPNATASVTRTNINDALAALGSTNSGASEPPSSLNNMLWYDTANHLLKMKAETGADWISIGYFDQSTDSFKILDDTVVTTAAGVDTDGIIGDQSTATWQAGTGTTESLVSPAKVLAAIEANVEGITHTSGSAPYYGVRAWGRVDGNAKVDGGNFASFNAASNTVTFTTPMPHANYAVTLNGPWYGNVFAQSETVNGFQAVGVSSGGNIGDISSFEFIVVC